VLAVLDANVLYPFQLRNLLLHLAAADLYEPLWSNAIIDEARRNLRKKDVLTEDQWTHLLGKLKTAFPEAWGYGFEKSIDSYHLPDANDRHVLALAVHYEAEAIITWNTRDFPKETLRRFRIDPMDPPSFVDILWEAHPDSVSEASERHRQSLYRSALSPAQYLAALRDQARLPDLAARLEAHGFLDP